MTERFESLADVAQHFKIDPTEPLGSVVSKLAECGARLHHVNESLGQFDQEFSSEVKEKPINDVIDDDDLESVGLSIVERANELLDLSPTETGDPVDEVPGIDD